MAKTIDPVEILLRNRDALKARQPLVIDPPSPGAGSRLAAEMEWPQVDVLVRDCRLQENSASPSGVLRTFFGLTSGDPSSYDLALIFMPASKRLLQMTIFWLVSAMPVGARILVVGAKRSGAASAGRLMQPLMGSVRRLDSARHCVLSSGVVGQGKIDFDLDRWTCFYPLTWGGRQLRIASLPGVFSYGELDAGTDRLLRHFRPGNPKRVLDLGCGQGVIGAAIGADFPEARVLMSDVHAAAIASAEETIRVNQLSNCTVTVGDLYESTQDRYDLIVTNPPFHHAGETERGTVEEIISSAGDHLTERGSLQLVANRFLPYQRQLSRHFQEVVLLHEDNRFRVWKASHIQ